MNPKRRQQIQQRWREIDAELEDIRNGKVTIGRDPATREGELDRLEYEVGDKGD